MSAGNKVLRDIVTDLEAVLNKCGVMYHVFYRTKSEMSIKNKLEKKSEEYRKANKKMQDLLALRITLYFTDDVELVHNYLKSQSNFDSESVDEAEVDKFCPKRLNLIMRVPNNLQQDMKAAIKETGYEDLIDNTYEVQIRTILSEGWHEVEHDLRYKCKEEWNEFKEESRLLNGIYATLESSEWSMLTLFDRLSYSQYKNKVWNSMLRNKMRVRFADKGLSEELCKYLSNNNKTAKLLYRANRTKILKLVMEKGFAYPLTYDTVLHLYICPIDRTGAHLKGLFVYFIFRDRHVVSPVEIRNDAARKVRVGVAVLIHQVIDQVERLELVVRIVVPVVMVSIEIPHGHLAVLLVMELALGLILFCLLLEDGVPTVNLVECLVKQFLLHLAIEPVLFRNLVLVSHLYAQDTGKQVGSVTGLGHCRLHICWILSVRNYLV